MSRAKRKLSVKLPARKSNAKDVKKRSSVGSTYDCNNSKKVVECETKVTGKQKTRSSARSNSNKSNNESNSSGLEYKSVDDDIEKGQVQTRKSKTAPQCLGLMHFDSSEDKKEEDQFRFSFQPFYRVGRSKLGALTDTDLSDDNSEKSLYLSRRMSIKVEYQAISFILIMLFPRFNSTAMSSVFVLMS